MKTKGVLSAPTTALQIDTKPPHTRAIWVSHFSWRPPKNMVFLLVFLGNQATGITRSEARPQLCSGGALHMSCQVPSKAKLAWETREKTTPNSWGSPHFDMFFLFGWIVLGFNFSGNDTCSAHRQQMQLVGKAIAIKPPREFGLGPEVRSRGLPRFQSPSTITFQAKWKASFHTLQVDSPPFTGCICGHREFATCELGLVCIAIRPNPGLALVRSAEAR